MAKSYFKVVGIVEGRNFYHTCTERLIHIFIGDNGDLSINDRNENSFSHICGIPFVFGIYRQSSVTQHGFGTSGGHGHENIVFSLNFIFNLPKVSFLFPMLHFNIGNRSVTMGTPIHNIFITVNQLFFIVCYKSFPYCSGEDFVHGKPFSLPIAGSTGTAKLTHNAFVIFVLPFKGLFDESLPANFLFRATFFP